MPPSLTDINVVIKCYSQAISTDVYHLHTQALPVSQANSQVVRILSHITHSDDFAPEDHGFVCAPFAKER